MWEQVRSAMLAGGPGGLATEFLALLASPLVGVPALPDRAIDLTPGPVFGALLDRLQYAVDRCSSRASCSAS